MFFGGGVRHQDQTFREMDTWTDRSGSRRRGGRSGACAHRSFDRVVACVVSVGIGTGGVGTAVVAKNLADLDHTLLGVDDLSVLDVSWSIRVANV